MKRPPAGTIPDSPGVYRFRDGDQRVIYVGKAKNLRSRISQYFQDPALLHPRTSSMVQTATELDWTVVGNEVEALQLEYAWIKEFDPRFNVKYRDDKSYPYLAITLGEEFPRAQVLRGSKRKGVRYFGPYSHAWAIRETLDQLLRVFPIRSCSAGVFRRAKQISRPCLLGYIGKCSAPCVGRVTADEHRELVDDLCSFLSGDTQKYIKRIERDMKAASDLQDYERAARLRDDIKALERALARNAVVLPDETDADVVAIAADDLEAAFQVFHVRGGRVRGQRGMVSEKTESGGNEVALGQFLAYLYAEVVPDDIPKEILVPQLPEDANAISAWLSEQRGSRVPIKVPARGDKRALMETVARNAQQSLSLHKVRRTGDLTARALALEELQEALALPEAPLRIECYDVSHLAGTDRVASMVVFEDGLPRKAHYRKFNLRGEGNDDVAAMREVIERRFQRLLDETENITAESVIDAESGKPKRFAYRPQLVVVDGGPAQVGAAAEVLGRLGITDITTIGLAKRLEEVWVADELDPLILPRGSQALYLLQRIRDEAHRFAITFQRQKRGKRATRSELEQIPGLGESRRKALLATFGSVKRIRAASPEELAAVAGIGPKLAESIVATLSSPGSEAEPAVNTATGEILP